MNLMASLNTINMADILSTSAVLTTILQYLSGALVCHKFVKNKSTGDSSGFPFICGFLSCSLWLKYGFLTNETAVVVVNSIGATLFFSYILIYWMFTINKRATLRQLVCAVLILGTTMIYTQFYEKDRSEAVEVVGLLCCLVTVIFFAAPCCMLLQVFRLKNTEMLPFPLILASFCVSIQWFIFGYFISDLFLQIPNFLGALLSGTQLLLFIIYPSKARTSSISMPCGEVPYSIFN